MHGRLDERDEPSLQPHVAGEPEGRDDRSIATSLEGLSRPRARETRPHRRATSSASMASSKTPRGALATPTPPPPPRPPPRSGDPGGSREGSLTRRLSPTQILAPASVVATASSMDPPTKAATA